MPPPAILPTPKDWKALTMNVRRNLQPQLLADLTAVDTEIGLYAEAFSMMARRNIASDVLIKAKKLRDEWSTFRPGEAAPQVIQQLIGKAGEAVVATGGVTTRPYDDIVCISYLRDVSAFNMALWNAHNIAQVQYNGATDNRADMMLRCTAMITAIREAYDLYDTAFPAVPVTGGLRPPDRTLRLFMAPEFFFRGRSGAYSAKIAFDVLPQLRNETNKPRYRNWLFVLGTVIMATFIEEFVCPSCGTTLSKDYGTNTVNFNAVRNTSGFTTSFQCKTCNVEGKKTKIGAMIDNFALVQKGGETGSENSYTVTKEWVSRVDFKRPVIQTIGGPTMPDWDNPGNRTIVVMGQGSRALPPEGSRDLNTGPIGSKHLDERMGGAVFEIDGIRFGLEVCLDHAKNRLTGNENVSVQLVPSCGMSFKSWKCKTGGLYFGVDGGNPPTAQIGVRGSSFAINIAASGACTSGGGLEVYDAVALV